MQSDVGEIAKHAKITLYHISCPRISCIARFHALQDAVESVDESPVLLLAYSFQTAEYAEYAEVKEKGRQTA